MTGLCFAGFDPSIASCGIAAVYRHPGRYELLAAKRVATKASDPLELRVAIIGKELGALIRAFHPEVVGIEEQRQAQRGGFERGEFNYDNTKTLIVMGAAIMCAVDFGARPLLLSPQRAKIAVLGKGAGHADKKFVQARVMAMTGATRIPLDASDAVAIAIAAAQLSSGFVTPGDREGMRRAIR